MADYWSENLHDASIEDLVFEVSGRTVSGGHSFGRKQFQGRGGQATEPTGRQPLVITIMIELFAEVNVAYYPGLYVQLIDVLNDDTIGGQITYVDPVFGPLAMQVVDWKDDSSPMRRNGAVLTIHMEERTTDTLDLTAPISVQRGAAMAPILGREMDQRLPTKGVFDEDIARAFVSSGYPMTGVEIDIPVGSVFGQLAESIVDGFGSSAITVDFVRAEIDRFRARVEAVFFLDALQSIDAWEDRRTLVSLVDSVTQAGEDAISRVGTEMQIDIQGTPATAYAIAQKVFGDPSRWSEIVASNGAVRNPLRLRTAGNTLRVFRPKELSS